MAPIREACVLPLLLAASWPLWTAAARGPDGLPEVAEREGYAAVEHELATEDGYLLRIHRIGRRAPVRRPPPAPTQVLLVHGIAASDEDFVRMGAGRSLAYLLADEGYDVWLANLRGNLYTSHRTLTREDYEFWDYSFHEHGKYDVPAAIEKILDSTNASRMHYVGYSMGATSYFVMCSERPNLADKIATFAGLAPVATLGAPARAVSRLALALDLPRTLRDLRMGTLTYDAELQRRAVSTLCASRDARRNLCYAISSLLAGEDFDQIDWEKTQTIYSRFQPVSWRLLHHYAQLAISGELSEFDWGKTGNLKHYGRPNVMKYNYTAKIAPTALIYGRNDPICDISTVDRLASELEAARVPFLRWEVPHAKFTHLDFVHAKDVGNLLNRKVVKTISILRSKIKPSL